MRADKNSNVKPLFFYSTPKSNTQVEKLDSWIILEQESKFFEVKKYHRGKFSSENLGWLY